MDVLYRRDGKLKEMGLGSPAKGVTLAMARDLRNDARRSWCGALTPSKPVDKPSYRRPASRLRRICARARRADRRGVFQSQASAAMENTLQTYCGRSGDCRLIASTRQACCRASRRSGRRSRNCIACAGRIERVLNAAKAERLRSAKIRRLGAAIWTRHCQSAGNSRAATMRRSPMPTSGIHGRPSGAPGGRGTGARIGDIDGDAVE